MSGNENEVKEKSENGNVNDQLFQSLGKTIAEINQDDLMKALIHQSTASQRQLAEAAERQANALEHIVKLLKPWAEREKRKNLVEQDPDYLEQVVKQVQAHRKTMKKSKPKGKLKRK